jgi:hypothetical protein
MECSCVCGTHHVKVTHPLHSTHACVLVWASISWQRISAQRSPTFPLFVMLETVGRDTSNSQHIAYYLPLLGFLRESAQSGVLPDTCHSPVCNTVRQI